MPRPCFSHRLSAVRQVLGITDPRPSSGWITMTGNEQASHECPIPGSAEAVELGCRCSAKRNNRGRRPPFPAGSYLGGSSGGWLIAMDCALHAASEYRGALIG